ncbi:MAG: peptidylprolyl isomerase [Candidatus Cloacimonetes bacterium]|nr:peptidylprolyl isomerase [Candidatus Cloacimonadota bacterium]
MPNKLNLSLKLMIAIVAIFLSASCSKKKDDNMNDPTARTIKVSLETNLGNIDLELWPDLAPKTVENFTKLASENFYENTYFHRVIPDFMIQGGDPLTKDEDRSNDGTGGPGYAFEDECYKEGGTPITGAIKDEELAFKIWSEVIAPYLQTNKNPDAELMAVADSVMKMQSGAAIMNHPVEFYTTKTGHGPLLKREVKHDVEYATICMANSGPNTNGSQFFIVTKKDGAQWLNGKHTVFGKVVGGMEIVHKIEALPKDASDNPLKENQATITKVSVKK